MGETLLRLEGREFTAVVVFAPDDASPMVGMTTLEIFGLRVDPIEKELVPVIALRKLRPFILGVGAGPAIGGSTKVP